MSIQTVVGNAAAANRGVNTVQAVPDKVESGTSPSPLPHRHGTMSKIAQSIGSGLVTSGAILGAGITAVTAIAISERGIDVANELVVLCPACAALGGVVSALSKYSALSCESPPHNVSNPPVQKSGTLTKVARSLSAGLIWCSASLPLSLLGAAYIQSQCRCLRDYPYIVSVFGVSALIGVARAIKEYQAQGQNPVGSKTSDAPPPSPPTLADKGRSLSPTRKK